MALTNCTINSASVSVAKDTALTSSVANQVLTITPDIGFVVAASDFTNNTTIASPIQSITLSDSGTPYNVNNEVNVVVTLVSSYTPTVDQTLVIDIDGEATRVDLIPISVGGDFEHTLTSVNVTQGSGSFATRDDLAGDNQYSVLDNPFETHVFATLTVAPTFSLSLIHI